MVKAEEEEEEKKKKKMRTINVLGNKHATLKIVSKPECDEVFICEKGQKSLKLLYIYVGKLQIMRDMTGRGCVNDDTFARAFWNASTIESVRIVPSVRSLAYTMAIKLCSPILPLPQYDDCHI